MNSLIALVPIKRESQRLPYKNSKLFAGRPLYHIVIDTLQRTPCISRIVINTDAPEIAEDLLAHYDKVHIHPRPERLFGDFINANDLIAYDLSLLEGEHFFQTHCTNPLLTSQTIEKAAKQYFDLLEQYDSMYSVNEIRARVYDAHSNPVNHSLHELVRTQDLPPVYEENSNMFLFSRTSFIHSGNHRIGRRPQPFPMHKIEGLDIDYPEDFILAELVYRHKDLFGELLGYPQKNRI